jgi:hypothetical protein
MNKREAERLTRQMDTLMALGFTHDEADSLRRISMTLQRWHERECGDGNEYGSWAIERDDNGDGKPYLVHHHYRHGKGADTVTRTAIPDRETGARKRLAAILAARNARITDDHSKDAEQYIHATCAAKLSGIVSSYIQGDPRGAALYIIRPGDVPEGGDVNAYYSRGICVY